MTPEQAQAMIEAINRLASIAEKISEVPESTQLAALWAAGFVTPMTLYLVSSAVGSIVNFWRHR